MDLDNEKQIYVEREFDYPGWTVVGKDRIVFNDEDRNSQSIFMAIFLTKLIMIY